MAKPIYAGSYNNRRGGGWKRVFIIVVLIQIIGVGVYLYLSKHRVSEETAGPEPAPALPGPALPEPAGPSSAGPGTSVSTPESQAVVSDARGLLKAGQLTEAKTALENLIADTPDPDAVKLLGDVNMKLLLSPHMFPGKVYHSVKPGEYLQKIARQHHTTVALIKKMNGKTSDNIRAGERLMVFDEAFSIRVSKTHNTLDLLIGDKLFKRYAVGTGKFGKTPAVTFSIVDKIIEPPWTRPSDNKQIEYGDPENVLGTRWMKIVSADHPEITGYGIHGTWQRDSIGKQSSAGCIRMLNEDVEQLFDLVPRKTTVIITE